ncbi:MAG: negative regulator of sigma E activity, partial [Methyloprofundus sp.]|nr:negative regulator of sigma E activity [Methyloprofundus sp.]
MFANMMQAIDTLNYQGTVALFKNGKLDTMKYVHAVKQGRYQERLIALNSPLRDIIRTSDKIMCRYQDSDDIVID